MNSVLRVAAISLMAGAFLSAMAGFKHQAPDAGTWSVSEEPSFQLDVEKVEGILVDPLGYTWVHSISITVYAAGVRAGAEERARAAHVPSGQIEIWQVFDPSGEEVAGPRMPLDMKLQAVGEDFVIGVWTNESGVEYVRRYSLNRG